MKTFDEYMVDNMGKKVGNGQCVALARDYVKTCFNIPLPFLGEDGGAIDLWKIRKTNPDILKYYEVVEGRPIKGDLILFNASNSNPYGHVAIVVEDRGDGFNVFESDGFNPNNDTTIKFWTWTRYAGALRPKAIV